MSGIAVAIRCLILSAAIPVLIVASWYLFREVAIIWFGYSLAGEAFDSAESIARGNDYCLIESGGAAEFSQLNAREIIGNAFSQSYGLGAALNWGKKPHFGIDVDGQSYFWSLKEHKFVFLSGYAGSNVRSKCTTETNGISYFGAGNL